MQRKKPCYQNHNALFHTTAPYITLEKKLKQKNKILSGGHTYTYFKGEETEVRKVDTQFVSSKGNFNLGLWVFLIRAVYLAASRRVVIIILCRQSFMCQAVGQVLCIVYLTQAHNTLEW